MHHCHALTMNTCTKPIVSCITVNLVEWEMSIDYACYASSRRFSSYHLLLWRYKDDNFDGSAFYVLVSKTRHRFIFQL